MRKILGSALLLLTCLILVLQVELSSAATPGAPISYESFVKHPVIQPQLVQTLTDSLAHRAVDCADCQQVKSAQSRSAGVLEMMSSIEWHGLWDMAVMDSHLYVAAHLGILAIDIRNPQVPHLVSQYYYPNPVACINEIVAQGGMLYLLTPSQGLQIFDATDPANLRPRGSLVWSEWQTCWIDRTSQTMEVDGQTLFVVSSDNRMHLIDVYDPDAPYVRSYCPSLGVFRMSETQGMASYLSDGVPYMFLSSEYANTPMATVDASNLDLAYITHIYQGAIAGLPPFGGKLQRGGHYLYAVGPRWPKHDGGPYYLKIMDLTNPAVPQFACSVLVNVPAIDDYAVEGDRLFISYRSILWTYDISEPCSPVLLASVALAPFVDGATGAILLRGDFIYNSGWNNEATTLIGVSDVSNPESPDSRVAYSAKQGLQLNISESRPVLAYGTSADLVSARIFDVGQPFVPVTGGNCGPEGVARSQTGSDIDSDYMFVTSYHPSDPPRVSGISVFDVHDSQSPVMLYQAEYGKDLSTSVMAFWDIGVANGLAVVAAGDSGLFTFEIQQSTHHPLLRSKLPLPPQARSVAMYGDRAYVVCWGQLTGGWTFEGSYLMVVDISDPASPSVVGPQEPWGNYNVEISGSRLATTSWFGNHWAVTVYQLDSTGWPNVVGVYDPPDRVGDMLLLEISSNYLYVNNGGNLDVVDIADPTNPIRIERYVPYGYINDVSVKGEVVYIGEQYGLQTFRGPACCEGTTGNVDGNAGVDLSDLSWLIGYMTGGGGLNCIGEADVDQSSAVDLSDLSILVYYLVGGEYQLPACE